MIWDSLVSKMAGYRLDSPGFTPGITRIFPLATTFKLALCAILWIAGDGFCSHTPLRSRMHGALALPPLTMYASMV